MNLTTKARNNFSAGYFVVWVLLATALSILSDAPRIAAWRQTI